jgi:hypothetical protein
MTEKQVGSLNHLPSSLPLPFKFAPVDDAVKDEEIVSQGRQQLSEITDHMKSWQGNLSHLVGHASPRDVIYLTFRPYFVNDTSDRDKHALAHMFLPHTYQSMTKQVAALLIINLERRFQMNIPRFIESRKNLFVPIDTSDPEFLPHLAYLLADQLRFSGDQDSIPYDSIDNALNDLNEWAMDTLLDGTDGRQHETYGRLLQNLGAHLHLLWQRDIQPKPVTLNASGRAGLTTVDPTCDRQQARRRLQFAVFQMQLLTSGVDIPAMHLNIHTT